MQTHKALLALSEDVDNPLPEETQQGCLLTLRNPSGLMCGQCLPSHLGVTLLTASGNNWGQLGY